jgi:hypothetical protein
MDVDTHYKAGKQTNVAKTVKQSDSKRQYGTNLSSEQEIPQRSQERGKKQSEQREGRREGENKGYL